MAFPRLPSDTVASAAHLDSTAQAFGWRPRRVWSGSRRGKAPQGPAWQGGRPSKPRRKRKYVFIALVIMTMLTVQLFVYVDKHVRGPLMHLAKIRVKQIATQAINKAITDQVMRAGSWIS